MEWSAVCGKTEILYCNDGYTTFDAMGWLLSAKNCDKNSARWGMRAFEGLDGLFLGGFVPQMRPVGERMDCWKTAMGSS
jgi:hypothetical protein